MRRLAGDSLAGFGSLDDRLARVDELEDAVSAWTAKRSAAHAMAELQSVGVPAGVVNRSDDLLCDPHLRARGYWKFLEREHVGELPHGVAPYRLNGEPLEIKWPSPTLGQHNREVLAGILGLNDAEISDLQRQGVIGTKPRTVEASGE